MVFVERVEKQLAMLHDIAVPAKFGGATGNFNAHRAAYPQYDWVAFANKFVGATLGPVSYTHLGREHGLNLRLVAEQYDTAVRPDRIECHDSPLVRSLGRIIAPHGMYTNL